MAWAKSKGNFVMYFIQLVSSQCLSLPMQREHCEPDRIQFSMLYFLLVAAFALPLPSPIHNIQLSSSSHIILSNTLTETHSYLQKLPIFYTFFIKFYWKFWEKECGTGVSWTVRISAFKWIFFRNRGCWISLNIFDSKEPTLVANEKREYFVISSFQHTTNSITKKNHQNSVF